MKHGEFVLYNKRKAEIIREKFGLVLIRFLDDLSQNWVNPKKLEKI